MIEVLVLATFATRKTEFNGFWRIVHGIVCSILLHVLMLRFKPGWSLPMSLDQHGSIVHGIRSIVLFILMGGLLPNLGWSLPTSLGQSEDLVYFVKFSCF